MVWSSVKYSTKNSTMNSTKMHGLINECRLTYNPSVKLQDSTLVIFIVHLTHFVTNVWKHFITFHDQNREKTGFVHFYIGLYFDCGNHYKQQWFSLTLTTQYFLDLPGFQTLKDWLDTIFKVRRQIENFMFYLNFNFYKFWLTIQHFFFLLISKQMISARNT